MRFILTATVCLSICTPALAQMVPPGKNPGNRYRLFFTTRGTTQAIESDIAYYDAFVQAEAEKSPLTAGAKWYAIVSTTETTLSDRFPVDDGRYWGGGLYLTNGTMFGGPYWSTDHAPLDNPPSVDQYGERHISIVFTGMDERGEERMLGGQSYALGRSDGMGSVGYNNFGNYGGWFAYGDPGADAPAPPAFPIYAMSEFLVVPSIPEPSAWVLALVIAGPCAIFLRRTSR